MPGPCHALEDGREAVHRDQHRGSAGLPPPIELGFDPIMVWAENLAYACDLLAFTQAHISWYRRAVAVDDKARIVLPHQGGVERVRDHAAEPGDADVPGRCGAHARLPERRADGARAARNCLRDRRRS